MTSEAQDYEVVVPPQVISINLNFQTANNLTSRSEKESAPPSRLEANTPTDRQAIEIVEAPIKESEAKEDEKNVILSKFLSDVDQNTKVLADVEEDEQYDLSHYYTSRPSLALDAEPETARILNSEKHSLPFKLSYDMNSVGEYVSGQPLTNGFLLNKINPGTSSNQFAYLTRNKLINRRLSIKKQMDNSSGLQPIIKTNQNYNKATSAFRVANPDIIENMENSMKFYLKFNNSYTNSINKMATDEASSPTHQPKAQQNTSLSNHLKKNKAMVIINEKLENQKDSNGPSPCAYHVPRKPPNQKTAPMFTIGKRCFMEKNGGARTSWEKEWFNSKDPFTYKTDFNREDNWPSPAKYKLKSTIGEPNQVAYHQAPLISIGARLNKDTKTDSTTTERQQKLLEEYEEYAKLIDEELIKTNSLQPQNQHSLTKSAKNKKLIIEYLMQRNKSSTESGDVMNGVNHVMKSSPQISLQFRRSGTEIWTKKDKTPGPGAYDYRKFKSVYKSAPKYSLPQAKLKHNSSYSIGPFSAF